MRHNLKAMIEARFNSQLKFSKEIGIHPVALNRICRGWREPTPVERERILLALGLSEQHAPWLFTTHLPSPRSMDSAGHAEPAAACAGAR